MTGRAGGSVIDERLTELTKKRYDRRAASYDRMSSFMERLAMRRWRELVWSKVKGPRVLEIGVGTGANLPFYPREAAVTAIDLSPMMLEQARHTAEREGVKVDLREMDAQHLDFPDDYFDAVVSTCVFCSVPNPVLGLAEVARVLKPDGQAVFLEHVRSETPFGLAMDLANPIAVRFSGANINRRTVENVKRAGLKIVAIDTFFFGIVKLMVAGR